MRFSAPAYPFTREELVDSGLRLGGDPLTRDIQKAQSRCVGHMVAVLGFSDARPVDNDGRNTAFEMA